MRKAAAPKAAAPKAAAPLRASRRAWPMFGDRLFTDSHAEKSGSGAGLGGAGAAGGRVVSGAAAEAPLRASRHA